MNTQCSITRSCLIICALFVVVLSCYGQDEKTSLGTLKGKIVDSAKAPIGKAFVLIHHRGTEDKIIYTDNLGSFAVELSPGFYDVFVTSIGFDPACRKIEINANKATAYKVTLTASKIENFAD